MRTNPPAGCPECGSDQVVSSPPKNSDDLHVLMQRCECSTCHAEWTEYFHYNSYEIEE